MFFNRRRLASASLSLSLMLLAPAAHAGDTISLLFAGDVMQHMPQVNSAYKGGSYDYEPCFRHLRDEIRSADLAVANLEVPLAGKPFSGYPQFSAPDQIASALSDAGFDLLLTANNHACDRYGRGIKRTLDVLDSMGIAHTGTFHDTADRRAKYPLVLHKNNFKIAFLNYTYGTNGIAVPSPYVVNLIDTARMARDIEEAKRCRPDLIVAVMHWGVEYARRPNAEQKRLAEIMFRQGVNIVVGAHPHVMQHMEKRHSPDGRCGMFVAYSLGNFVSNQSQPNTDGGAMLRLVVSKDSLGVDIVDAAYNLVWVYKPIENKKRRYFILPAASVEHNASFMDAEAQRRMRTFLKNSRQLLNKENVGVCEYRLAAP